MKLKHRLSLYSVVMFGVIMLVFSIVIYLSYYAQLERKEQQSLESKSLLAAIYYLEQDELSFLEHTNVKNQLHRTISRQHIVVFDSLNNVYNGDMRAPDEIPSSFITDVRHMGNAFFKTDLFFYNGIFYPDNEGDFVVITRESRTEFNAQMSSLFHILMAVFLFGILFIFLFSQYLSYIAYQPIIKIISQIKDRDSKNFNEPLSLTRTYTEIGDLVNTYNHFVKRIEKTFNVQKNFIDYVSHELRTPITALLGTLEVTKSKPRSVEEYERAITQLRQYTLDLQTTLDQMMLLSGAKTNFELQPTRVDEVLWQLVENMVLYHRAHIDVDLQVENNALLTVEGNDKLLELAIGNVLENAIKYSNNKMVKVMFREQGNKLVVSIIDQGIGIPQQDLQHIRQNFYRGHNTQKYQGKGIGLSMANIIFSLHQVEMEISSSTQGTIVHLHF
ncbi:sensor histidine kinase [Sphingobacterium gobiense]|uniref:histidine kinase n=1 Tax=Sphingobacterium gobiense TaxID=1382456 RepID=A0A2S9JRK5_9SPHI|nr:HAMP domain-containing sensor histidine kinase [Sphingobacterium gobiense]PRD55880.1 histidine kinase [Sphingobacterium gobiense]